MRFDFVAPHQTDLYIKERMLFQESKLEHDRSQLDP
jgi:hypothetical protein